jgi:hypothetical protein
VLSVDAIWGAIGVGEALLFGVGEALLFGVGEALLFGAGQALLFTAGRGALAGDTALGDEGDGRGPAGGGRLAPLAPPETVM